MMSNDTQEISLGAFFGLIWRQRLLIALMTVIAGAGGSFYAWRSPAAYEADTSLLLPSVGASPLPSADEMSGARMGLGGLGGGASPLKMFRAVLESERTVQYVAQNADMSIRSVRQVTRLEDESGANTITLKVTDRDPQRALLLSTLYIEALKHVNSQLNLPFAGAQVAYLNNRLQSQTEQLMQAESRLLAFAHTANGSHLGAHLSDLAGVSDAGGDASGDLSDSSPTSLTPDMPASGGGGAAPLGGDYAKQLNTTNLKLLSINHQIDDLRKQYRQAMELGESLPADYPIGQPWRQKLAVLKQNLKVAEQTYGPEAPHVVQLQGEIEVTRQKMQSEVARALDTVNTGVDPQVAELLTQRETLEATRDILRRFLQKAPSRNMEFENRLDEVRMLKEIVASLRMHYEEALQLQARDPNRWEVLDKPFLANYGKPINKGYIRYSVLAGLLGLFIGTGIAIHRANRIQPTLA